MVEKQSETKCGEVENKSDSISWNQTVIRKARKHQVRSDQTESTKRRKQIWQKASTTNSFSTETDAFLWTDPRFHEPAMILRIHCWFLTADFYVCCFNHYKNETFSFKCYFVRTVHKLHSKKEFKKSCSSMKILYRIEICWNNITKYIL